MEARHPPRVIVQRCGATIWAEWFLGSFARVHCVRFRRGGGSASVGVAELAAGASFEWTAGPTP